MHNGEISSLFFRLYPPGKSVRESLIHIPTTKGLRVGEITANMRRQRSPKMKTIHKFQLGCGKARRHFDERPNAMN
jgi:hypothetical protein